MSCALSLQVGNSTVIEVQGLQNSVDETYQNAATVTCTLTDLAGASLAGETWPKTMVYVAASNGNYRATLSHEIAMVVGSRYLYDITAVQSGSVARWRGQVKAVCRPLA